MQVDFVIGERFDAVGLSWEGTYAQAAAGETRMLIADLLRRKSEIVKPLEPARIVGVSWNERPDGFRYFIGVPVEAGSPVPAGMIRIEVPALECVSGEHTRGDVSRSYQALLEWMEDHGLKHDSSRLTYLEEYPPDIDPAGPPRLRLFVPVLRPDPEEDQV